MIPKTLHYCWFGNNPKTKVFQACLVSWELYCPDFEIMEWNENNTKQFANLFYNNALRKEKYAFVADYVRTKVLFEEGGVYLDTDMLLLQPVDALLQYEFFIGEEVIDRVAFGLFGAIKKHRFLKQMLDFYEKTEFNVFSPPVITHTFSSLINKKTIIEGEKILDINCFYSLSYENRFEEYDKFVKPESYAVHMWDHSWEKLGNSGLLQLIRNLQEVAADYVFYKYSFAYFKRYTREFSRKIYHKLRINRQ